MFIYIVASVIKRKNIAKNPQYKYFVWGILAKIIGAVCLCLIYVYYYKAGGDTLNYDSDSSALLRLLFISPPDFLEVWFSPLNRELLSNIHPVTGYLMYGHDPNAFIVVRLIVPIKLISFGSYLVSSILMAALSFTGIWKLYCLFCTYYHALYKQFAITVLFVPSVVFWGSGLLKDSWTIAAAGWYAFSFYQIFINKRSRLFYSIALVVASVIMILIKPYIFLGLLPGSMLWMSWSRLTNIKNVYLKIFLAPLIVAFGLSAGFLVWSFTSSSLGDYSTMDSMLQKAVEASEDLKKEYYQGNSFDLGSFEPTLAGVISKFPIATMTGLFRPFIWEVKNMVMFISAIENMVVLIFTLYVFFASPWKFMRITFANPVVLFCLIFAVFFAFSVAISTSNFGAMVRLRIPQIPFLLSGLAIIYYEGNRYRRALAQESFKV
ncbi:MAG: hypothetical protein EPN85_00615 [Bacteroidetes bacterium]|nr:MAG: hypothetical protein EPN85_00615 [Bacteroidota bacterium]